MRFKFNLTVFIAGIAIVVLGAMLMTALKNQLWLEAFRDAEMIGLILYFAIRTPSLANIAKVMYAFIGIHFSGSLIYGLLTQDPLMTVSSLVILIGVGVYWYFILRRKKQ